jgi:hypothetical protein
VLLAYDRGASLFSFSAASAVRFVARTASLSYSSAILSFFRHRVLKLSRQQALPARAGASGPGCSRGSAWAWVCGPMHVEWHVSSDPVWDPRAAQHIGRVERSALEAFDNDPVHLPFVGAHQHGAASAAEWVTAHEKALPL